MRPPIVVMAQYCSPRTIPPLWTVYHRHDATLDYARALSDVAHALGLFTPPVQVWVPASDIPRPQPWPRAASPVPVPPSPARYAKRFVWFAWSLAATNAAFVAFIAPIAAGMNVNAPLITAFMFVFGIPSLGGLGPMVSVVVTFIMSVRLRDWAWPVVMFVPLVSAALFGLHVDWSTPPRWSPNESLMWASIAALSGTCGLFWYRAARATGSRRAVLSRLIAARPSER